MAYFNNHFSTTNFADRDFNFPPFVEQPGSVAGQWVWIPNNQNNDSVAPATQDLVQGDHHHQPLYSGSYFPDFETEPFPTDTLALGDCPGVVDWPAFMVGTSTNSVQTDIGQLHSGAYGWEALLQAEPQPLGPYAPFADGATLGASTIAPTPINVPLYWGDNQGRPPIGVFHTQNARSVAQPSTGPTRTGTGQTKRFCPHGTRRARETEQVNAEAGPSRLRPLRLRSVGLPTRNPSGGDTETSADAENKKTNTEENKAPTKKTKTPRGQGKPRPYRVQWQDDGIKLRELIQTRKGLGRRPKLHAALETAIEEIRRIRQVEHEKPRLRTGLCGVDEVSALSSKRVDRERKRRRHEAELYGELSRYYPRDEGRWGRPVLLRKVMEDLENHPDLQSTPDELASEVSTPTAAASESP